MSPKEYNLQTPLSQADVEQLELGDVIYLTGKLFTIRDWSHQRVAEYAKTGRLSEVPFALRDLAVLHSGPIIRQVDTNHWEPVSVGPTSSSRFSPFVAPLLRSMGPRLIVGKGTMTKEAIDGLVECGAAFAQGVGGCAALYGSKIKRVANCYWPEFGMTDAVWEFDVEGFGPLSVEIDCRGNNSYQNLREVVLKNNLARIYEELGLDPEADFIWWPQAPAGTRKALKYATTY
ncbi:MAG: fumarate hydratase C-terminal domain-containing protein [Chloroflexi bacterium]|nr:fumarate hydratase C-terminal domain-containing protein [Chloroflexota bacterium]